VDVWYIYGAELTGYNGTLERICTYQKKRRNIIMWKEGTIGVPTGDGKLTAAHYWCKHFDEPSEWGIDGGRISKLQIKIEGRIVVNYDRGWDVEPDEENEATMVAYGILMKEYN
jgi:hypothetical protein